MISPFLCCRMPGSTALTILAVPNRLASNRSRACSTGVSSIAPISPTPALLISTSIRPARSWTQDTHPATDSSEVTSSGSISNPAASFPDGFVAVPKTWYPCTASSAAVACPIPREAPVTSTTDLSICP